MKKTQKISIFLSIFLIFLAIFALNFVFFEKNEKEQTFFEAGTFVCEQSEKTKPVISSDYENGVCEFVYDGTVHQLEISISSDQELAFYNLDKNIDESVQNYFKEIGEYNMKIVAKEETDTFSLPDPLYLTVRVLPNSLVCNLSNGVIDTIKISHEKGFCLDNSYSATNLSKSQKRAAKKAVKNHITYEQKIVETIQVAPSLEAQNYDFISVSIGLPKDFSLSKNYRFFEYTSSGELKELTYVIQSDSLEISSVATSSLIIISANKTNPYLWIWITIASASFVAMAVIIYFFTPRKLNFYIEGSKIYVAKLGRRQSFSLSDGLENYEWFIDKNLTTKAESFGVKETSKNYYARIKR